MQSSVNNGLRLAAIILGICVAGALVAGIVISLRPGIEDSWSLYIETISPEHKILALSSSQRYTASKEFTARLLAIVKVKASIELEAWADVYYVVDASDPALWNISWDRKTRALRVLAPEPECLPPAVRTDTIEIRTKGANLLTNTLFQLKEEARKMELELSADCMARARASCEEEAIRTGVRDGLAGLARSFCVSSLGIEPKSIVVELSKDSLGNR
jgi:hypothetical protein